MKAYELGEERSERNKKSSYFGIFNCTFILLLEQGILSFHFSLSPETYATHPKYNGNKELTSSKMIEIYT